MIIAATICMVAFGILAIIDGVYYHDIKYRLAKDKESILEHIYHTIRAVLFTIIMYTLFAHDHSGPILWLGVTVVAVDMLFLVLDVREEGRSRNRYGGLSNGEYMNHIFANAFHFVSIALILAAKPLDAWAIGSTPIIDRPYPLVTSWIGSAFVTGGGIASIMHFWQWSQFVSTKGDKN